MKRLFFRLGIALLTFFIGIALSFSWSVFRQSLESKKKNASTPNTQWAEYGTLKWNVQMAKARGEKEYAISSISCGMGVSTLKEALSSYTIVLAHPVEKKTFMNTHGLNTWYKFKVSETLSSKPIQDFHRELLSNIEIPIDLLPVNSDEILISERGGVLEVEGVKVAVYSNSPHYSLSSRYLLFLEFDSDKRVGFVPWTDEIGTFTIDDSGRLKATDNDSYDLKEKIASRFGNSVERLKSYLEHQAKAKRQSLT